MTKDKTDEYIIASFGIWCILEWNYSISVSIILFSYLYWGSTITGTELVQKEFPIN